MFISTQKMESEELSSTLDHLFFDKPVVHEVKPIVQEGSVWQMKAAPVISGAPVQQDVQKEAEQLSSFGFSQKTKKFLPPFRRPSASTGQHIQTQTDKANGTEVFAMFTPEMYLDRFYSTDSGHQACSRTLHNLDHVMENRSYQSNPQFKTCLFKAPLRRSTYNSMENTSVSLQTRSIRDDHSLGAVTKVTEHPLTLDSIATCSPFQTKQRSPSKQNCDPGADKAPHLPNTPKPVHIQGSFGPKILCPVSEIPVKFRCVFKDFPYFNYVQSKALEDILYSSKNFVACAPTGSGKTVLFELAIIKLLMETAEPWHSVRAVYMAPIKALCSQRYENWKQKFGPLGLNCKELTGDTEIEDFFEIRDAHIIMTTPEKWDSMTRKRRDSCVLQSVRLILIDEVHVVKDSIRGATLEVVVSRMKTMHSYRLAENSDSKISTRFLAVSATIPNICDVADWLSDELGAATCLEMDESHRPVKLRKVVLGFPCGNNQNEFRFDLSLNYKMASIIQTYSDQKPTLIFCSTRKGAQQSAAVLAKDARFIMSTAHKQRLMKYASSVVDSKLRDLVMCGIAYHHAGVSASDRKVVEDAFTVGDLPIIFTTTTLAMGVNLPAHLVVIKSTMHYVGGSCEEYSETDILQMMGRAGRPQFDTSATAVIMTRNQTRDKYTRLVHGSETIESSLHTNLVEHLNAEIALHTISDVNMALDWICSTFLYIRALRNPKHYGFTPDLDKFGIETKLQELCLKNLNALASFHLITMDEDINIKPTDVGKLMARYYVAFETMKQYSQVTGSETLSELIEMISKSKEFSDVQLRVSEKRTLNTLNKDKNRVTIRYPMGGKIKSNDMKVNCLIQAQLGCIPIQEFGLTQDTGKIFRTGTRLSKCLADYLSHSSKKNFSAYLNSLVLAKCFKAKLWENSPYVSKQLDKIGLSLATAMVNAGLTSFDKIEATNARELELIVNRHPPFGNQIREAVSKLPKYEVNLEQLPRYSASTAEIVVTVLLKNFQQLMTKRSAPNHHYVTLLIGDSDNNVLFQQKILDTLLLKTGSWVKKIEVGRRSKGDELSINLISSEYVGLDVQERFSAFYLGVKRFEAELYSSPAYRLQRAQITSETSTVQKPHTTTARTSAVAPRAPGLNSSDAGEHTQTDPGKRPCSHFCKNKELCAHECCKAGIRPVMKRPLNQESSFSSHLRDLKERNEKLMETPVKRLKMRMNSETEANNMQHFSYKPKEVIPAHQRFGECQYYPQTVSHNMTPGQGFTTSSEMAYLQSCHEGVSVQREASQRQMSRIPASSTTSPLHLSTDSGFSSDALNVTFDLAVDDWDDMDEDNLVLASDVYSENCGSDSAHVTVPLGDVESQTESVRLSSAQRFGPPAETPPTETWHEISVTTPIPLLPQLTQVRKVTLENQVDSFLNRDAENKERQLFSRDPKEERKEDDVFLGIFDGIF